MTPLAALVLATVGLLFALTLVVVGLLWAVVVLLQRYRPRP